MIKKWILLGISYLIGIFTPVIVGYNKFANTTTKTSFPLWMLIIMLCVMAVAVKFFAKSFDDFTFKTKMVVLIVVIDVGLLFSYSFLSDIAYVIGNLGPYILFLILTTSLSGFFGIWGLIRTKNCKIDKI